VIFPAYAGGNGFANGFIAVVKMADSIITQGFNRWKGCIEGIFFKNRNPDNRTADICVGVLVKDILMYRPGTLVPSQRAGG
jgi:hypothetical protein